MIGQTFSHYSITQKLGEGGMGVVYRARDLTLDRDVALKFLTSDLPDNQATHEKTLQEARAISALNHPNICTIYEVGEAEGRPYLAMEYLEGHSLHQELTKGGMPPDVVVRYGMQLADALGHAHERGIVHRDLKAANVIVTPSGRLKVLDFGLSRRAEQKVSEETTRFDQTWGQQHPVTGTLPYIAPEVLKGQDADARSDIWALGIMLYEMAVGKRPFRGATYHELSAAILREALPPLSPTLPPVLQAVISKCLDKDPSQRYHAGGEVRAALEAASTASTWQQKSLAALAALSGGTDALPRTGVARRRVLVSVLGMAAAAALLLFGLWWSAKRTKVAVGSAPVLIQSLAVLPLENLSGDPAQDYFADGMTDALITELSQIQKLRVISRTSVMQYKRTQKPLEQIARELRVDAVVEGSVVRANGRVRIAAKLIHAGTQQNLWADSYERNFSDVLALQGDVATAIARGIQVELSGQEASNLASSRAVVPEAYEAYLKGKFESEKRTPEGFTAAVEYFQEAIAKDPTYASAYAGLADNLRFLSNYQLRSPAQVIPQAKAAAEKALQLDDRLAEAHASLATIRFYHLERDGVESEFQRAIALNPGYATAHHWYALYLAAANRHEEAMTEIRLAQELDPRSLIINANVGWCDYLAGNYDQAIDAARKTLLLDPSFAVAHGYLGQAYLEKKRHDDAIVEFRKALALSVGDLARKAELAAAYARAGETSQAQAILQEFQKISRTRYISPYDWAVIYAGMGSKEQALAWLSKAFEERNGRMANLAVHPMFASLHGEPRFQELLKRMGAPLNPEHATGVQVQ